jgi:hypothetical protein
VTALTGAGVAGVAASGLTVADVIRAHGAAFLDRLGASLTGVQRRALRDLAVCRTEALGGHLWRCLDCGHERVLYNSCRNRHCPTCQASVRATWLAREASWLLPSA